MHMVAPHDFGARFLQSATEQRLIIRRQQHQEGFHQLVLESPAYNGRQRIQHLQRVQFSDG